MVVVLTALVARSMYDLRVSRLIDYNVFRSGYFTQAFNTAPSVPINPLSLRISEGPLRRGKVNTPSHWVTVSRSLTGCRVNRMLHTRVPPPCAPALLGGTSR